MVRTSSLRCLCTLFKNGTDFDWTPYKDILVAEAISPVIERLPLETTQGVSWTCRLLSTWSLLPRAAMFLAVDRRILPKIVECLAVEKAKDEVRVFALDTVRNLVQLVQAPASESEVSELIRSELLDPNLDKVLKTIYGVLGGRQDIDRNLLEACIEAVLDLSPLAEKSDSIRSLVDISSALLNQPSRKVSRRSRALSSSSLSASLCSMIFRTISP